MNGRWNDSAGWGGHAFKTALWLAALMICAVFAVGTGNAAARAENLEVGSYVTFGTYPQTAEGDDETPIEWLVLNVDGDRALLLSRYGLDAQPYNVEKREMTWAECTLRAWLNDDFVNRAFTAEEQSAILLTNVDNSSSQAYSKDAGNLYIQANSGNDTQDQVFLLSYAEANAYLGLTRYETSARVQAAPTAYAKAQRAWTSEIYQTEAGEAAGVWWLRSSSGREYNACYVGAKESLYLDGTVDIGYICVRPALWVNLASGIF